ncbi:HAD-IA family hydrolase [Streptomyces sp. NRRL S-350]|uniref:HAD-IA family hydrolase n=1 Tax=Streptomyces sp. NRRL S-350 TaxID=1463902 RepID=UPI000691CF36|nr:HAD-IA family hydrolase [Streptomyces sp. NRRL S-350]
MPVPPSAGSPVPLPGLRAIVFDLDGVLVDSFEVTRQAFALAYAEAVGDGQPPFEEYVRHPGRYFPDVLRIMGLPATMEEPFVRESHRLAEQVTVHPGVRELLAELRARGIRTAVATGKSGPRARSLLECLGLVTSFDTVVGSDEVPRGKPAPDIVDLALARLGCRPEEALMVGDAVTDLASARAAGVPAVAAAWGEGDEDELRAEQPHLLVHAPAEILALCPARRPRS